MAKSKKTSDAFDMAADIRKEVAAESVADACSTSVPAIYSLAKGDNPRRAKYDKNADVIGYNLRLPANIHRLLKRHCMETNESMNNVVLVALYRDMKNWEDLAPCPHCGAILPVGAQFCPYCASPFERPLTRVRKQEIEDYILDTIRIGMKSDTVLDPETVIDFLCNISDGGFELYDPKFEIYFNSGITYGADNLELLHVTKHEIDLTVQRGGVIFQDVLKDWSIEPDATIHVWRFSESESDVMTSEFSLFMLGLLAKIKAGTIWKSSLFILSCLSDHQV